MAKDVLSVIKDEAGHFSKGQRRIANYIFENYDKAAFMTANRLGAVTGVSEIVDIKKLEDEMTKIAKENLPD